jgi:hypothetical protein
MKDPDGFSLSFSMAVKEINMNFTFIYTFFLGHSFCFSLDPQVGVPVVLEQYFFF